MQNPRRFDLSLRIVADEKPEHGQEIMYVAASEFYGSYEFEFGKVDYQWIEVDEDGLVTGVEYFYEADGPEPEGCIKVLLVGDKALEPSTLWCPASEVDDLLDKRA
jgi:hypothetical protein